MKTRKFTGLLKYKELSVRDVARDLGMSVSSVYRRMETSTFTVDEILRMRFLYGFSDKDVLDIFFEDWQTGGGDQGGAGGQRA